MANAARTSAADSPADANSTRRHMDARSAWGKFVVECGVKPDARFARVNIRRDLQFAESDVSSAHRQ